MIREYEEVIVKSRVLMAMYMIPVTLAMVIRYIISLPNDRNDNFDEYGFSQRCLYVIKLRR